MKTVIVIPTYNEKGNIGKLIDVVQKVIKRVPKNFDVHILVVDDTSPDGTAEVVKKYTKKYPWNELMRNLETLCSRCHYKNHK